MSVNKYVSPRSVPTAARVLPVTDHSIAVEDGRTVGYAEFGPAEGTPVLWCHGGPGSRLEPEGLAPGAAAAGYRVVGIDRPGYGLSTPLPGRTIAGWVPDALAVADELGLERFATVGVSTGGAYALAVAAIAPTRVLGAIACCALTDMRWTEGKSMMTGGQIKNIWSAPDRETAMAIVTEEFGADGSKMAAQSGDVALAPADMELFTDVEWLTGLLGGMRAMFAQGVAGYADDRLADGPGWGSFDVADVSCPVIVTHGGADTICPVAHAHHTASIVPGAQLRVFDHDGHFSIALRVVGLLDELLA